METPTFEVHEAGSHGKAWSLDRRVPIALVITTAVQPLAFAWFANGPFAHPDALSHALDDADVSNCAIAQCHHGGLIGGAVVGGDGGVNAVELDHDGSLI